MKKLYERPEETVLEFSLLSYPCFLSPSFPLSFFLSFANIIDNAQISDVSRMPN